MKYRPTKRGALAVIFIAAMYLLMAFIEARPAYAVPSLEVQRAQREASAQRRHEIELEKIRAAAYVEAAKYEARA